VSERRLVGGRPVERGFRTGRRQVVATSQTELGQMPGHEEVEVSYTIEIMTKNDLKLVEPRSVELPSFPAFAATNT
jgi:hypothetical protein